MKFLWDCGLRNTQPRFRRMWKSLGHAESSRVKTAVVGWTSDSRGAHAMNKLERRSAESSACVRLQLQPSWSLVTRHTPRAAPVAGYTAKLNHKTKWAYFISYGKTYLLINVNGRNWKSKGDTAFTTFNLQPQPPSTWVRTYIPFKCPPYLYLSYKTREVKLLWKNNETQWEKPFFYSSYHY